MTANLGAVAVDTPRRLQKSGRGVAAVELGFMVADIAVVVANFPRTDLSTLFNPWPTAAESSSWRLGSPPEPPQLSCAEPTHAVPMAVLHRTRAHTQHSK